MPRPSPGADFLFRSNQHTTDLGSTPATPRWEASCGSYLLGTRVPSRPLREDEGAWRDSASSAATPYCEGTTVWPRRCRLAGRAAALLPTRLAVSGYRVVLYLGFWRSYIRGTGSLEWLGTSSDAPGELLRQTRDEVSSEPSSAAASGCGTLRLSFGFSCLRFSVLPSVLRFPKTIRLKSGPRCPC